MTNFSAPLKDSGERSHFPTGAVRDAMCGKGRMDLLPVDAIEQLAIHFEKGGKKYDDRNWEKGIPLSRYLDSALRHTFKTLRGDADEPHAVAAAWNLMCFIQTRLWIDTGTLPVTLDDLPTRSDRTPDRDEGDDMVGTVDRVMEDSGLTPEEHMAMLDDNYETAGPAARASAYEAEYNEWVKMHDPEEYARWVCDNTPGAANTPAVLTVDKALEPPRKVIEPPRKAEEPGLVLDSKTPSVDASYRVDVSEMFTNSSITLPMPSPASPQVQVSPLADSPLPTIVRYIRRDAAGDILVEVINGVEVFVFPDGHAEMGFPLPFWVNEAIKLPSIPCENVDGEGVYTLAGCWVTKLAPPVFALQTTRGLFYVIYRGEDGNVVFKPVTLTQETLDAAYIPIRKAGQVYGRTI